MFILTPTVIPEGLMVSIFFQYNSSPSHKIKSNEEKIEASYVLAGFKMGYRWRNTK
jgi:hypothetical protein